MVGEQKSMPRPLLNEMLEELNISYQRIDHPPVYTSEQARQFVPVNEGASAKNLFLRDKKGKRHFLVMLNDTKDLDLVTLADLTRSSRLSFGSPERLLKYLEVEPGAVSPLALINDLDHQVELWIDNDLWLADSFQCHPLVNTATLILARADMASFFHQTGHQIHFFSI